VKDEWNGVKPTAGWHNPADFSCDAQYFFPDKTDLNRAQPSATNGSRLIAHSGMLIVRLFELLVEMGIRSIIFAIPTAFVAQWCDVPLTGKAFAFLLFCSCWHRVVFGDKEDSARRRDPSAIDKRKAVAVVMTPAQVAAEARKLVRASKPTRSAD
jgi:hypothetical protein